MLSKDKINFLKDRKIKSVEYKGGKCIKCGYDKYVGCLDFHHRDSSQKDKKWKHIFNRKWEYIVKELDKCDLLCHNCHGEIHEDMRNID